MNRFIFILAILFAFIGCTTDNEPVEVVQPTNELSEAEQINKWIYDEMNHYYLWRDDLPDSMSCDFGLTPKEFYNSLLSPKDRFSYLTSNSSARSNEEYPYWNFGFHFQKYITNKGERVFNVLYITSNEVKKAGVKRGDFLCLHKLSYNKFSFDKVEILSNGTLNYLSKIEYYTTASRSSKNQSVYLDSIYKISGKNIGYLCYLEFNDPTDFQESINNFAKNGITDLILDLRYNPGGLVNTCKKLCNAIVSENGYGKLFQQCSFNDIVSKENLQKRGNERTFSYFSSLQSGASLGITYDYLKLHRLFVLTSTHTASASESTINSLKPFMEVFVIGENTIGKGVGMYTLSNKKYNYALVPITFRYYNANEETVPDEGLVPDYFIPDGYATNKKELGDINEPLLNQALRIIFPETFISPKMNRSISSNNINLTPVGEPSYIHEFNNKNQEYEN